MTDELDALIHQRTRLRIMTLLHKNRNVSFMWLQKQLDLTPGNLDSHASQLARAGYVEYGRKLTTSGFESRVRITRPGDDAFRAYRHALLELLQVEAASGAQKTEDGNNP